MTREQVEEAVKRYGSQRKAAVALRVSRKTMRAAMRGGGKATAAPAPTKAGKSLADFRQQYDKATIIPGKVRAAIKALGASGWEYEVEFAKLAGVGLADLGRFRDAFAGHVVQIGRDSRRAWAGSLATATAMREMLA